MRDKGGEGMSILALESNQKRSVFLACDAPPPPLSERVGASKYLFSSKRREDICRESRACLRV